MVTYLISIFMAPGYLEKKFDFIWLVDNFLENNINLDNLCIFDQLIKSDSSFHCTICNRCSANYDHHCNFINNCLGTRNHKYFLTFLFVYFTYSLLIIGGGSYRFYTFANDNRPVYDDTYYTIVMFIVVMLPLPVLIF